jgi:ankyrin repeat protein
MKLTRSTSALHWALKLQQEDVVKELLSHSDVKLNIVAKDGYTPLMYAVQMGNEDIVQV